MKAIIHIGTAKTGTTSIQNFLNLNRGKLLKQNIAYLRSPGLKNNKKLAIFCMDDSKSIHFIKKMGFSSKSEIDSWKQNFKQNFDQEICHLSKNITSIILSSEQYYYRLITLDEIKNLQRILSPNFKEIEILIYLKRQDLVNVSRFSNICKGGEIKPLLLKDDTKIRNQFYNYFETIEKWSEVFGKSNINIRIFEKENFVNSDLLDDFAYHIGMSDTIDLIRPDKLNIQLSAKVQNLLIAINPYFPKFINQTPNKFNIQLRKYIIQELRKKYPGNQNLPSKDQAISFYRNYSESNKKLANKYLSSENIFSNDFSMYPEKVHKEQLTEENYKEVIKHISDFISDYHFTPKRLDKHKTNPSSILRYLARIYKHDYPKISLLLIKEVYRSSHKGSFLIKKINEFLFKVRK